MIRVTSDPVRAEAVIESLQRPVHGAVVTFLGTVRKYTEGREVLYLDYEAYPEMAEEQLREIAEEVKAREGIEDVALAQGEEQGSPLVLTLQVSTYYLSETNGT